MPNVRSSKQHWYNPISGQGSYVFDALSNRDFPLVASVVINTANTTVLTQIPVPQRMVIAKVIYTFTATAATASINIVVGTGAEGAVGTGQTVAVAGTIVFAADTVVSGTAANTPTVIVPSVPEVIYDTGQLLTLRAVTNGTGTITNLQVALLIAPIDPFAFKISSANPSTDF